MDFSLMKKEREKGKIPMDREYEFIMGTNVGRINGSRHG
jgi:hypothetical protein